MAKLPNQIFTMKSFKRRAPSTFTVVNFLLSTFLLICCTTAKRFDINSNLGSIEDFDIPELIEVNKVDSVEPPIPAISKLKPNKPKPEFSIPSFPQLPQNMGLTSSWSLGTSLGSSHVPEFSAQRPPTPNNSPYYPQAAPGQAGISHGPPPRPPPVITSNTISDNTYQPTTWTNQPQSPPVMLSQQSQPQQQSPPPPVLSQQPQPQPNPTTIFMEDDSPPPSQQSPPPSWSSQTPSASANPPSPSWTVQSSPPSWSQSPPVESQSPQWLSQPQPASTQPQSPPMAYQQPQWYSQPQPQQAPSWSTQYSPPSQSQPSKPFSLYQQLNLHLLEPSTWDKLQDQKVQWEQAPPPNRPLLQQQPPPQPTYTAVQTPSYSPQLLVLSQPQPPQSNEVLIAINTASNNTPLEITSNNIGTGSHNEILDPIDSIVDYIHPGQPVLPQVSNSDITIDDDKFFDNDDDFEVVDGETNDDEIMTMVE